MRILAITESDEIGACEAYRAVYPLAALQKLGHTTRMVTRSRLVQYIRQGAPLWRDFELILFQRLTVPREDLRSEFGKMIRLMRGAGCTMVCDYDDDFTNRHRKVHEGFLPDLSVFSALTVSTPVLRDVMLDYNRRVQVLPNLVPMEMFSGWNRLAAMRNKTVVGLTGSFTHAKDWEAVARPLRKLAARGLDFSLFVTGTCPPYLKGLPNLVALDDLFPDLTEGVRERYLPLKDYGGILAQIDILLAPVDPSDRFNWSKSNLKAIEGQASARVLPTGETGGCAVIATGGELPNYKNAISDGLTGRLVNHNDAGAWEAAIERLIVDAPYRYKIQAAGYQSCKQKFSIEARVRGHVAAYQSMVDREHKVNHKVVEDVAALFPEEFKQ